MKIARTLVLAVLSLVVLAALGLGKAEYAKKEGKPCTYCHTPGKFKELTDAGKYHREHKTLEGYAGDQQEKK